MTIAVEQRPAVPPTGYPVSVGYPRSLGATVDNSGVNFAVYADRATSVDLLLFNQADDPRPFQTITLDPVRNKTFDFWHVHVDGLRPRERTMHYAFRASGLSDLHGQGDRYNRNKVLIDPYARGNTDILWNRADAVGPNDNVATSMRSVVIDPSGYDWEGDQPLNRPLTDMIIYEMHVRGFTRSCPDCRNPGTFFGLIDKIPYLRDLGVTAVELLPIFDFDEKDVRVDPATGQRLTNYWGYDPFGFFAPQSYYCVSPESGDHLREFRDMVKALHRAGIEVILDVVFNHTTEGNENGPTISFKGLANSTYYLLTPWDRQYYWNFAGTGNCINANHPITEKFIIDVLEYWVKEMHVDGFRFDEAVVLSRGEDGEILNHPPVIWQIELSDKLANTKIIAEAWDTGFYQLGHFPGYRWGEWNGRYRDAIRSFVKGDAGYLENQTMLGRMATVIAGSTDLFQIGSVPTNSINYFASHDGFTLNDLVSYNYKHNEANGENNQDGTNENRSWNCGVEGPTQDPNVETLRERQIRNFFAILLLSQGIPMFMAGDEVRHTQNGNNNPYNQDNPTTWFDWGSVDRHANILRFFRRMIQFRRQHACLRRAHTFSGQRNTRGLLDIDWHGCRLDPPDWNDPAAHALSFTMGGFPDDNGHEDSDIHVILNMYWQDLDFDMPVVQGRSWYKVIDTAQQSPNDISENLLDPLNGSVISGQSAYRANARSVVVFISR